MEGNVRTEAALSLPAHRPHCAAGARTPAGQASV